VEHRLQPGTKLAEQKLADHFGVSRTLVRQALFQLAQNRLVTMEPARGAFVAAPTVEEARQVFQVRRMLEAEMTREFVRNVTPAKLKACANTWRRRRPPVDGRDAKRIELLGDFHVRMAELMGNEVLAQILRDLVSRSSLITLMYQRAAPPRIRRKSTWTGEGPRREGREAAVRLMEEHLLHVEESLAFDRPVPPTTSPSHWHDTMTLRLHRSPIRATWSATAATRRTRAGRARPASPCSSS
jgi:DNA-binding GntR family transcriptional regulator